MENKIQLEPLNQLKQKERLKILTAEITAGKSRKEIQTEYAEKWKISKFTIRNLYNEAIVLLFEENPQTRDELRQLNLARLDELYDDCSNVREKVKVIDLINRTASLYENNVNLNNTEGESFKFDIGVDINGNNK